jgi:predicted PurR-regulated permease PerM
MPVDVRSVALSILAIAAVIMMLRYMQEVFVPLVLGGLLFYALDPLVDWMERHKVPRALGASLVILALVGGLSSGAYALRFQVMAVVEQLPLAAQRFREAFRDQDGQAGTLSKMQEAAKEIEKTADSVAGTTHAVESRKCRSRSRRLPLAPTSGPARLARCRWRARR